jgi:hypothetical protein
MFDVPAGFVVAESPASQPPRTITRTMKVRATPIGGITDQH